MAAEPEPFKDLDWQPDRAQRFGERIVALWAEWLGELPALPVDRGLPQPGVQRAVAIDVPDDPMGDDDVIDYLRRLVFEHSMYPGHPGFVAYVSGAGTVPGAAADLLAAGINQNLGGWRLSPGATEIELHLGRWFAQRFGLPEAAGGILTSGGAMANFVGLKLARDVRLGHDVRALGLVANNVQLTCYASDEVHSVSENALDMLGIGSRALRMIPVDDDYRIRADVLSEAIRRDADAGMTPFAVIASAGTVATGAIDPLEDIAEICAVNDLWFHVDAAYGGPAVLAEDLHPLFAGIERADSIAFDPHKWLYTAHSGGCLLVRDLQHLSDSFSVHGSYIYQDAERTHRGIDLNNLSPQFSRGFQGLRIWISLLAHGRRAYARRISHDAELARYLGARVEERDDFELAAPVSLSICCFRYVPGDVPDGPDREVYLDELNQRIMTEVQSDGRTYFSNAVLRGRFVLRACIVNFRTEVEHLDKLLDVAAEIGARIDHKLRR